MDATICAECGEVAEVLWRDVLESTDGPVEHAKTRCVQGHCLLLPVASLARISAAVTRPASGRPVDSRRR